MSVGTRGSSPAGSSASDAKDLALRIKDRITEHRVGLIAAGVAFYGLLALFPGVTALVALGGLVIDPAIFVDQLQRLSGLLPDEVIAVISSQAMAVAGAHPTGLGLAAIAGFAVTLYSASKGTASLIQGLNIAYDETENRGFIRLLLLTLALTLFLIFGLLAGLAATLAVPAAIALLGLGPAARIATVAAVAVVLIGLTILGLTVLYRFAPARGGVRHRRVVPGAVTGCLLWIVASAGFAFYVANFAHYNESFGTLGGAIAVLMWFWVSAYVNLVGAELNAALEERTRVPD